MHRGYIKLFRKITEWEWYKDIPVHILFEHCLYKANLTDKNWKGIVIKQGSFVTSLDNLAFETGLSKMQVRTAINKLKLTHEITYETTTQYSIITVNNWIEYQINNTPFNTQITHEQHTNNTQITLTKEYKNNKNEKKYIIEDNQSNEQAHDKLASIEFRNSKDYQFVSDVYKLVYGCKLPCRKTEQLVVIKNWFNDIPDFTDTFELVLKYFKDKYKWSNNPHPPFSWLIKEGLNYQTVYNDWLENDGKYVLKGA